MRIASNPQNTLESVMIFGKRNSVLRRSSLRASGGNFLCFPEGEAPIVLQKLPHDHHKLARPTARSYAWKRDAPSRLAGPDPADAGVSRLRSRHGRAKPHGD